MPASLLAYRGPLSPVNGVPNWRIGVRSLVDLGLGDADAAAHLGEPEGALFGAQLLHPGSYGGLVGRIGIELGEELIPGVLVELAVAHRMSSTERVSENARPPDRAWWADRSSV